MIKPHILIIDDEPKMLLSLSELLKNDFIVHTAQSGVKGLILFERHKLDLILLDLNLPLIDGVETLKRIRERDTDIKVIIMTGRISHEWASKCTNLNIQGYLQKPFEPDELIERMKNALTYR